MQKSCLRVPAEPRMEIKKDRCHLVKSHQIDAADAVVDWVSQEYCSGVVVLPCGSGKTLVGILAMVMAKRRTMVVCSTVEQVSQWLRQICQWTHLQKSDVYLYSSNSSRVASSKLQNSAVIITTYQKLSKSVKQAGLAENGKRLCD